MKTAEKIQRESWSMREVFNRRKSKVKLVLKIEQTRTASTPSSVCEKRWESLCQVEVEAALGSEKIEGRNEKKAKRKVV